MFKDFTVAAIWIALGLALWAVVGFGWLAVSAIGCGLFIIFINIVEMLLFKKTIKDLEDNRYW